MREMANSVPTLITLAIKWSEHKSIHCALKGLGLGETARPPAPRPALVPETYAHIVPGRPALKPKGDRCTMGQSSPANGVQRVSADSCWFLGGRTVLQPGEACLGRRKIDVQSGNKGYQIVKDGIY